MSQRRVRTGPRPHQSRFQRLATTHALMMAGNAAMVVALADSLFLSISADAARGRVLLFLGVSFLPFLVVAPLIGPVIDRMVGGRRLVVQAVALSRVVLCVLMAFHINDLLLFPLAFASLVLQKAYELSKSSLVPAVVRSDDELVEANSKLGLIAGLIGFIAVIPAGLLQISIGGGATLGFSATLFTAGLLAAIRLPREPLATTPETRVNQIQLHSAGPVLAASAMAALRGSIGFLFFHLAFYLRAQTAGTAWFGAALVCSSLGTMLGNAIAPRLRRAVREEVMLLSALALSAGAGIVTAVLGGPAAGVVLATALNLAGAVGRMAFESTVQRDAPGANHGRAFARFETGFQVAWVLGGVLAVALLLPGGLGYLLVGVVVAVALVNYMASSRRLARGEALPPSLAQRARTQLGERRTSRSRPRRAGSRPGQRPLPPPRPGSARRPGP